MEMRLNNRINEFYENVIRFSGGHEVWTRVLRDDGLTKRATGTKKWKERVRCEKHGNRAVPRSG